MIKDTHLRIVFIPILGILIPLVSGIITYDLYTLPGLIGANLYFIFTSFVIWLGCNWIHSKIRPLYSRVANPFIRIIGICLLSALYGASVGTLSTLGWLKISEEVFSWNPVFRFVLVCSIAVIVFTLVYEILFLNKERELDTKIVDQLEKERTHAELQALHNEMDPHFIFNALNTLNHLIIANPGQAHLFNNKLAQVYKYFLLNKNKELVSLKNEMEFIDDYFFLLQLRHDNKLQLHTKLGGPNDGTVMLPPCSLQILVENAIKHNEFSTADPLKISIEMNGQYLKVLNRSKPKPYLETSTRIGLKNLSSRYKIICNKDIVIEQGRETFLVKLPIIR
ncbi:MAG TPA: sensor histidine kinase [Chitinophagaceae bacterium]|nr:sensor histidine kinase [Chitinophagaceae bacterium]